MELQTFVGKCKCQDVANEASNDREKWLNSKKRDKFLINELTKQIVDLNRWRKQAILEAVEKDR